jgi:hypothetical protein
MAAAEALLHPVAQEALVLAAAAAPFFNTVQQKD